MDTKQLLYDILKPTGIQLYNHNQAIEQTGNSYCILKADENRRTSRYGDGKMLAITSLCMVIYFDKGRYTQNFYNNTKLIEETIYNSDNCKLTYSNDIGYDERLGYTIREYFLNIEVIGGL